MKIGVITELSAGETRVALVPEIVAMLCKKGYEVLVESGAGVASGFLDGVYAAAGATLTETADGVYASADVLLRVHIREASELSSLREGTAVMGFLWPLQNLGLVRSLASRSITSFAMDAVPRITRAQSMDALSAMSTIAGYKAVVLAAAELKKFCPMLTTAAGTIKPARALILGAGVAGLTAIGIARRLGAVVEAFDVRAASREQVQSLGAKFLELGIETSQDKSGYAHALTADQHEREVALIHKHAKDADFVITTALIPGKKAPILVTDAMLRDMAQGSVVVDLAASQGGNCEGSVADQKVLIHGVTVLAPTNLPATMPTDASGMYARVIANLLLEVSTPAGIVVDSKNEVTKGCCITHKGEVTHEPTRAMMSAL